MHVLHTTFWFRLLFQGDLQKVATTRRDSWGSSRCTSNVTLN